MTTIPTFAPPTSLSPSLSRDRTRTRTSRRRATPQQVATPTTRPATRAAPPVTPSAPSRTARRPSTRTGPPVLSSSSLQAHLTRSDSDSITVVKVFASYCASCRGTIGPFRKVASAYASESDDEHDVSFVQLDFAKDEGFARERLGVTNLPHFALFRGGRLVDGGAMGWKGLSSRLMERIEAAREAGSE